MTDHVILSELDLSKWSRELRACLERAFSPETAQLGSSSSVPSAGQCAAVAVIVQEILGGQMVSARVNGFSHWFNRLPTLEGEIDLDITADQFGHSPILTSRAGDLYPETRVRKAAEVAAETRARSDLLKQRSGVSRASCLKAR